MHAKVQNKYQRGGTLNLKSSSGSRHQINMAILFLCQLGGLYGKMSSIIQYHTQGIQVCSVQLCSFLSLPLDTLKECTYTLTHSKELRYLQNAEVFYTQNVAPIPDIYKSTPSCQTLYQINSSEDLPYTKDLRSFGGGLVEGCLLSNLAYWI